jgi:RimJ/RimL family protein N-acetyltransferase
MQPPTEVTDNSILLRQYQQSDIPMIVEAVRESGHELKPWVSWYHENYSEVDVISWIKTLPDAWRQSESYDFAIIDCQDGSYLGGCGINHIRWTYRFANLGYWVRTDRIRQGIASRIVPLLARFAFEHLGLIRVEIVVAEDNHASLRVAEKVGAFREGVLRNRMLVGDRIYNSVMHSLVPQDFDMEAR